MIYECIELFFFVVVKKNGSCVDYDCNKVKDFMCFVLCKCFVFVEVIDEVIVCIEEKLFSYGEKEIGSDCVGEFVMCEFKWLDKIGYIWFVLVYWSFEDLVEF